MWKRLIPTLTLNLTLFFKNKGGKDQAPNNLIIEVRLPYNVYPKSFCSWAKTDKWFYISKLHISWPKLQINSIIKGKAINVDNTKMRHNDFTWAAIACVIVYSVSPWNCLHKDLHCTGEISTSPGETYILYRFSHEKKNCGSNISRSTNITHNKVPPPMCLKPVDPQKLLYLYTGKMLQHWFCLRATNQVLFQFDLAFHPSV